MKKLDLETLCIFCHHDTAPGSGRFSNRIPAETDLDQDTIVIGFACELCYTGETDRILDRQLTEGI